MTHRQRKKFEKKMSIERAILQQVGRPFWEPILLHPQNILAKTAAKVRHGQCTLKMAVKLVTCI